MPPVPRGRGALEPAGQCHQAGPLGAQVCGDNPCDAFCLLDQGICGTVAYPSVATCVASCNAPADGGPGGYAFVPGAGEIVLTAGDSFNCRLYHLESAANPVVPVAGMIHCPQTALISDTCFN